LKRKLYKIQLFYSLRSHHY